MTTLGEVAAVVERERITSPAIIVVGEVVRLRERLQWFAPRAGHGGERGLRLGMARG